MFKIVLQLLISTLLVSHATPLLQTGQTISYDENGIIVSDGSVKDDGFYQAGVTRSYIRNGDVVIDYMTGLKWQDDSEVGTITIPWITQANYDAGNYFNTSGQTAATYCSELKLDDGVGWRLPSIEEIESIADYGEASPALSEGIFLNYSTVHYWSSTTSTIDSTDAWVINPLLGNLYRYYIKTSNNNVRCVRGKQFDDSNLSRNVNEVVSDHNTNLQWQDDTSVLTITDTWMDAIGYCEDLILDTHTDWRLPNIKELLSIVDFSQYSPAVDTVVENTTISSYWSSTTIILSKSKAWYVDFYSGASYYDYKYNNYHVRCVRGGVDNLEPVVKMPPAVIMYLIN